MSRWFLGVLLSAFAVPALSASPKCDSPGNSAASMVFVRLKNAGIVDNRDIDFGKTKVVRLASERIGKDLYRQVHRVTYFKVNGDLIDAITVNDASHDECSMTGVEIFIVGHHFGADE
jgi:hypothetical protein